MPRTFSLKAARIGLACVLVATVFASICFAQSSDDKVRCNKILSYAFEHRLIEQPVGNVVVEVGKKFLGSPYAVGTLDSNGMQPEHLVIDLREFDCVTYIENVLALARVIKANTLTYNAYQDELQRIRYREGKIDGYSSRLNYFLDWIQDNEKKGVIKDVTAELGGKSHRKKINFMSMHRSVYPHLSNDSTFNAIHSQEERLSEAEWSLIPKSKVDAVSKNIQSGDIIAIATNAAGLDFNHTAIAVRSDDGTIHLLHAPKPGERVLISHETLAAHLADYPKETGVVILRPL